MSDIIDIKKVDKQLTQSIHVKKDRYILYVYVQRRYILIGFAP